MKFNGNTMMLLALVAGTANAWVPQQLAISRSAIASSLRAATLETPVNGAEPTTWECDEDAQCVEVPACDEEECRTSLDVRIHGEWYDLTG